MVNVNITGSSPGGTVVRAVPRTAGGSTGRVGDNVGTVTLEDGLTGVASASMEISSSANLFLHNA